VAPTLPLRAALEPSAPVVASARTFADAARFRDAMAQLASGVAIVACLDRGAPRGLLVSSLTSLSVEPPRMLFCVRKTAGAHDALVRARRCSLSVLSDRHGEEAERFSSSSRAEERFSLEAWRLDSGQPPQFSDALVSLTGSLSGCTDAGSHTVFFMDIETVESAAAQPLIYFGRGFRALGPAGA